MIDLKIRNVSRFRHAYRRSQLLQIAQAVLAGERPTSAAPVEISLLFCDDEQIAALNKAYRNKAAPTDVLSFEQPADPTAPVHVLGDIVVSLETAARNCGGDAGALREEVRLLFCHGLLHLLGYDHATPAQQAHMQEKQAAYLGVQIGAAWRARVGIELDLPAPQRKRGGGRKAVERR